MRSIAVDFSPLREVREFRYLWLGQAVSMFGRQITVVAVPYQVYLLTHSSAAVGGLGLAQLVPYIAVSLIGGNIADTVDRRKLLLVAQVLLAATSAALMF